MALYLIQFRINGYAKNYLKNLIFDVSKKFNVHGMTRKHVVPHITLFGPFTTTHEKDVLNTITTVVKNYERIHFKLKGFGEFHNKVIYVNIEPSEELKNFRRELSKELISLRKYLIIKKVKTINEYDYNKDFAFHSTIAFKDIDKKFHKIFSYMKSKEEPNINQILLRITILKNGKILREYDFIQKKLLTREESLNKHVWKETITRL